MIAILQLELIGNNYRELQGRDLSLILRHVRRVPREHAMHLLSDGRRPWAAEVRWMGDRWHREFLSGQTDYRDSDDVGSRGMRRVYTLTSGRTYEVHELTSWAESRRFFCRVDDATGEIVHLTEAQART